MSVELRAEFMPSMNVVQLYGIRREPQGDRYAINSMTWSATPLQPGYVVPMLCSMEVQVAQVLMDDLWNAGIRPGALRQGRSDAGEGPALVATRSHLADMRRLAFSLLSRELDEPSLTTALASIEPQVILPVDEGLF